MADCLALHGLLQDNYNSLISVLPRRGPRNAVAVFAVSVLTSSNAQKRANVNVATQADKPTIDMFDSLLSTVCSVWPKGLQIFFRTARDCDADSVPTAAVRRTP